MELIEKIEVLLLVATIVAMLPRRLRAPYSIGLVIAGIGLALQRGALALALALGLPNEMPGRREVIAVAFAVVAFSILVQGLTITPLMRRLGEMRTRE